MGSHFRRIAASIPAVLLATSIANAQTLKLTGISSYWANPNGSFISAPWTSDHTPTGGNWFGIWVSDTPGGAFLTGASQSDLGRLLSAGTNDLYAALDAAPPHAGLEAYRGFNLFFDNEINPRISIVTPTSTFASYATIAGSVMTPRLRYDAGPFVNAAGASGFTDNGYVYALTAFDERMAGDRVYANLPQADGYDDPEFHFGITVTSVVPEPSTELMLAAGLLYSWRTEGARGRWGASRSETSPSTWSGPFLFSPDPAPFWAVIS
ncbi:MAG: hypothetical protein IPP90_07430 [Gemmatimonadaceae bacterium]|nr:hypothetical protein [Gemmatimonadaceae bacterium]